LERNLFKIGYSCSTLTYPYEFITDNLMKTEKLQKVIADTGFASRRKAEELIKQQRVQVEGKIANIGMRVEKTVKITVDNQNIVPEKNPSSTQLSLKNRKLPTRKIILYNKKIGEVCSTIDANKRPIVFQNLPVLNEGRWIMVGRLDINTSGLLLFTNDGDLANFLMHPKNKIEREYIVTLKCVLTAEQVKNLTAGVVLEDGFAKFKKVQILKSTDNLTRLSVILCEGRNREVRRIFKNQNILVFKLKRIRFGDVTLPRDLEPGKFQTCDKLLQMKT